MGLYDCRISRCCKAWWLVYECIYIYIFIGKKIQGKHALLRERCIWSLRSCTNMSSSRPDKLFFPMQSVISTVCIWSHGSQSSRCSLTGPTYEGQTPLPRAWQNIKQPEKWAATNWQSADHTMPSCEGEVLNCMNLNRGQKPSKLALIWASCRFPVT